jgi:hypothetical protein
MFWYVQKVTRIRHKDAVEITLDLATAATQVWPMKFLLPILTACLLGAGCASNSDHSASGGATSANTPMTPPLAGDYAGKWTASDGASGTVRVSLKKPDGAPWDARVNFTYDGDEASTTTKSVQVNGDHVVVSYDYDVQGNTGGVEMSGDLTGDTLQGSYTTTGGNPGTWTTQRRQ